ncbi:hypothetical protein QCA50_005424 [Cerrena zonata]|uniref:(S)-ureidoglycine aminohydrolase cupin domain-containing protein n=1 Tax=Cerrena zonata TaxID=2478898 RepID=A0AAW0GR36_9APHY
MSGGLLRNRKVSSLSLSTPSTMSPSAPKQATIDNSIGKAVILPSSSMPFVHWEKWGSSVVHNVYHTNDTAGVLGHKPDGQLVDEIKRNRGTIGRDRPPTRTLDMEPGMKTSPLWSWSIDYGVVLKGNVLVDLVDGESREVKEGELILPRGSVLTWKNMSTEWCKICFVLKEPSQDSHSTLPDNFDHGGWYRSEDIDARLTVELLLGEL